MDEKRLLLPVCTAEQARELMLKFGIDDEKLLGEIARDCLFELAARMDRMKGYLAKHPRQSGQVSWIKLSGIEPERRRG